MQKMTTEAEPAKGRTLTILENILLIVCLCIIVLRASLAEMPLARADDVYSLTLSTILMAAFFLWLVLGILANNFIYRKSFMEISLLLLVVASCIAGLSASNGRAAITNAAIFAAPIFMAILLVQILDSDLKIKLTLATIAAAGFLNFYQSADQFFKSNDELIRKYKEDPKQMLDTLGIEPGSIDHFQFEHRLYSKGITGYFTTSNSAGSFAILAVFAAAVLLIEKVRNRKRPDADPWYIISGSVVTAGTIAALLLTRSKGAIAAFIIAAILFAVVWLLGKQLYNHRKKIIIACILSAALAVFAIISYGLSHNRLPGGNSMLVRWQYWQATARIYKDRPLTGVGAGNFANAYFHYKLPQSLEDVSDPHNFLLSILTQYGPLGLAAFIAIIAVSLYRIIFIPPLPALSGSNQQQARLNKIVISGIIFAAMLLVRPLATSLPAPVSTEEWVASSLFLYVMPAAAFLVGFLLVTNGPLSTIINQQATYPSATVAALSCAVIGLLIHNLADFAIFEPGVFTAFCACVSCLIATDLNYRGRASVIYNPAPAIKGTIAAASIVAFAAIVCFCLLPVTKSISKVIAANQAAFADQFSRSHFLLEEAARDDPLSPLAPSINGQLYITNFIREVQKTDTALRSPPRSAEGGLRGTSLLLAARDCFEEAISRDKYCYKDYELLSNLYLLLAQTSAEPQKSEWLNNAFITANQAVSLYPASDRLRFYLAQIADRLGKIDFALENYKKAVEFEEAFREQFKIMYPGREQFSRLGQVQYDTAKQRIELLSKKPDK